MSSPVAFPPTAVALALLGLSSLALATPPTARLAYEAPAGCPTQSEFVAAVTARGADFDGAEPEAAARRVMVVSIRKQGVGFSGAFQLRDQQGPTNRREVQGPTCAEVADALAVVTAIALRPASAPAPRDPPPPPPPTLTPPAPPALSTPPPPVPEQRFSASTRAFPPRTESVQVHAGALRFDLQRSVSLYAGVTSGLVPSVLLPRYDLSGVAANFVTTPEGAQRITGLVLETRVSALGKATYQSPDTKTDVVGLSFGFDLCQSPHYDTRGLVLLFCGEYGGGLLSLTTRGADGVQIQSKRVGFGAATLSVEVQYNLGSVFEVGAKVGGGFTIGDVTAERADGSRIFGSSLWSAYALLGVGLHF